MSESKSKDYYIAYLSIAYYNHRELLFVSNSLEEVKIMLSNKYDLQDKNLKIMDGYVCDSDIVSTPLIYYVNIEDSHKFYEKIAYRNRDVFIIVFKTNTLLALNEIKSNFDWLNQCDFYNKEDNSEDEEDNSDDEKDN